MIVSHKLKCIFIAIPKTATHAIRFALRPYLDEKDEEQVALFVKKSFSDPNIARLQHGHISAQQLRASLGEEIWNSYYKFSFVRNPYDRFLSYCSFIFRDRPDFHENPQAFMYNTLYSSQNAGQILLKAQHFFLCDEEQKPMLDFIGTYENLQEDFDKICSKLNLPTMLLDKVNSSTHKHYKTYYNKELEDLVREKYQVDFNVFKYSELL